MPPQADEETSMTDIDIDAIEAGGIMTELEQRLITALRERDKRIATLETINDAHSAAVGYQTKRIAELERVYLIAAELCNSIDSWAEDIGGYRRPDEILKDLGPAVSVLEQNDG